MLSSWVSWIISCDAIFTHVLSLQAFEKSTHLLLTYFETLTYFGVFISSIEGDKVVDKCQNTVCSLFFFFRAAIAIRDLFA